MDNSDIQEAAKLLLDGACMLYYSCPKCKNPLYRLKDKDVICVTCKIKVIIEEEINIEKTSVKEIDKNNPIQRKIELLDLELQKEKNPDRIIEIANIIRKLEKLG